MALWIAHLIDDPTAWFVVQAGSRKEASISIDRVAEVEPKSLRRVPAEEYGGGLMFEFHVRREPAGEGLTYPHAYYATGLRGRAKDFPNIADHDFAREWIGKFLPPVKK